MGERRAHVADDGAPKADVTPIFYDNWRSETKVLIIPDVGFAIFAFHERNMFNQLGYIHVFRLDNHFDRRVFQFGHRLRSLEVGGQELRGRCVRGHMKVGRKAVEHVLVIIVLIIPCSFDGSPIWSIRLESYHFEMTF